MYFVGIDIGGTFTDVVFWDRETRRFLTQKVLTNALHPEVGVLDGFTSALARDSLEASQVQAIVHATTLASNAIIERRGGRTALITTKGFRDLLELGRGRRPGLYDFLFDRSEPLVPREWTYEVTERIVAAGEVLVPLAEEDVRSIAQILKQRNIRAVGICLLHSFRNPSHEEKVAQLLESMDPSLFVSLSSHVAPEIREYERASTTVANAFLQPVVSPYLEKLTRSLEATGFAGRFFVMLSSGGVTMADTAARFPVRLVESGPAAGVMAACFFGQAAGERQLISLDMGGTTAKISLVTDGKPTLGAELEVARAYRFKKDSGLPLKIPSVELVEIGAGGGSIAQVDRYGLLQVGPQSAEARPGPVCYGLGGEEPTVTDADLVLGYLDPDYFLGGQMRLDRDRAETAIREKIAAPLGMTTEQAAWGIYHMVNAGMASATLVYSAEKGIDLRGRALLAFGGAAPVHACAVAEQVGISSVIVPFRAGVASAFGLLVTPPAFEFARSYVGELREVDWTAVADIYEAFFGEGAALLQSMGIPSEQVEVARSAQMRYRGQSYEIIVDLPPGNLTEEGYWARAQEAFNDRYRSIYGHCNDGFPVEALVWRASVRGPRHDQADGELFENPSQESRTPMKSTRVACFSGDGSYQQCSVYDRYGMGVGTTVSGPAIIEEIECTTLVRPGWTATIDSALSVVLRRV